MTVVRRVNKRCSMLIWALSALSFSSYGFDTAGSLSSIKGITAYTNANILEPSVELPISNATILVADGKILKIQPESAKIPTDAKQIDLNDNWVIPGLIDGHVHLAQSGGAFTRPDIIDATKISSYQDDQSWLLNNHEKLLANYTKLGITSIFDLGGPNEYLSLYKHFAKQTHLPEIYFAGSLLSPMAVPQLALNGETFNQTANAEEAITAAKQQLENGANILKIVWTDETGLSSQQLIELYKPAVTYAKENNLIVAIHIEQLAEAKMAVKLGADILVHGVMREAIDNELLTLMKQNNVTYMPTLAAFERYFEFFKNELDFNLLEQQNSSEVVMNSFEQLASNKDKTNQMMQTIFKYADKVDETAENIAKLSPQEQAVIKQIKTFFSSEYTAIQKKNLKQVAEAGINIAVGTDAGNLGTLHGVSLFREINAWRDAGISNKAIIKALTRNNAIAYQMEDAIGSLTAGKHANFVVLATNPYQDITTLAKPVKVVKQGVSVFSAEGK